MAGKKHHQNEDSPVANKAMFTSSEVIALLRINRGTLCSWCRGGKIPHLRLPDNSYRFYVHEIEDWLDRRHLP